MILIQRERERERERERADNNSLEKQEKGYIFLPKINFNINIIAGPQIEQFSSSRFPMLFVCLI